MAQQRAEAAIGRCGAHWKNITPLLYFSSAKKGRPLRGVHLLLAWRAD
jgi:hypothetical protein